MSLVVMRCLARSRSRLVTGNVPVSRRAKGTQCGAKSRGARGLLTRAYDCGPTTPPLLEQTIPEHFDSVVEKYGDRNAVISHHQNETLTYLELRTRSNAVARGLQDLGVKKGDRVAISMGNCIEFAVATYSLFRLGAILVPLNPAFTATQVISALNHLTASHLIIGAETILPYRPPEANLSLLKSLVEDPVSTKLKSTTVPSLTGIILADNATTTDPHPLSTLRSLISFADLASPSCKAPNPSQLHASETVNIQFTSGTTSSPKAAMLTHHSILNNGHSIGTLLDLGPDDAVCCPPPLFHCFGCVLGYMATATHGSAIVFPAPAFDPAATLKAVSKYKCTALYGVPTMFHAELALLAQTEAEIDREGFKRLRTGIAAGSSVPAALMRKLHRELGLKDLAICYGMTETSPVSCMTTATDPLEKRVDTVGKLMPHVQAKVVDPVTKELLGVGERGELMISGYLVMKGYWGDEERTREALVSGKDEDGDGKERTWIYTGDEAVMDAEGYVSITGRIKDLIIRGGENIHPLEIEDCVLGMDSVIDVSVVGVKDERYGEVVVAFVIKAETHNVEADSVRDRVRGKLGRHLVPKHVFFTDAFPKTASGKVQKFTLRETAESLLKEEKNAA